MYSYATLDQLLTEAASTTGTQPTDPTKLAAYKASLTQYGIQASGIIDRVKHTTFAPIIDTRYLQAFSQEVRAYEVDLDFPLLELTSVTLADGTNLVVDTDVQAEMTHIFPRRWLQMITSANSFRTASDNLVSKIAIVGVWGWHSDYDNAWILSGDSVQKVGGIDDSETSVLVTDVDGVGGFGFTPRFSAGNLIQIENEWCSVMSTDTSAQTMVVVRGVRGSTAATHAKDVVISVFHPDDAIGRATAKLAVFMYAARGKTALVSFENVRSNPNNVTALAEVLILLEAYQFVQMSGV